MDSGPSLTIVLLGNSGVGKSASGNTILGRPAFDSRQSLTSVTRQISEATETVFGKQISVIDTPGIFDAEEQIKAWCQELLQSSRPCLILVVFRVGRFTREQGKVLAAASRVIGPQLFKMGYLLFTGGDDLKEESLEDFVFKDEERSPLVQTFSRRCHLFNNDSGEQEQVRDLLLKSGHLRIELPAAVSKDRRIVLLGRTGGGKSSSGNTILGSDHFESASGFNLVSKEIVSESATVEGRWVTVVDTPGFTDRVLNPKQLYEEIMKSLVKASPGPHAFVIVVRLGNITNTDVTLFELLPKLFESGACKYSMVLFTHGDDVRGRSIDDLIQSNTHVSQLVSMCSGRYCVFDNKARRSREQVRNFLYKVDEIVTANGGEHYSNELFKMAEKFIREEKNRSGETAGETVQSARSRRSGSSASPRGGGGDRGGGGETAGETAGRNNSVWKRILPFLKKHKGKIIVAMIVFGLVGGAAGFAVATEVAGTVGAKVVRAVVRAVVGAGVVVGVGAVVGAVVGTDEGQSKPKSD